MRDPGLAQAKRNILTNDRQQRNTQNKGLRDSATEEAISTDGRGNDDDDEIGDRFGSPMLSPRSNKPSEHITYKSIGLLSKN